jgi:hypothetical protein
MGKNIVCSAPAFFFFFFFLFQTVLPAAWASKPESDFSRMLWAFQAIRASANNPHVEPVTTGMVLSSGDKLKIMIQVRRKCFTYVFHRDSSGDLAMLFPYSLKQFEVDYRVGSNYYAPKGEPWFQLDGKTGTETFYLIASDQRLLDIEYAFDRYAAADQAGRQRLAGQMISQLDTVSGKYLTTAKAERLAGIRESAQRGFERAEGADPTDIAGLAREISFDHIYSETFVIHHQ